MALYQIKISYDGTDFHGYQRQARHRTVQGELETALKVLGWAETSILSSGRTDAGVHADGQIAIFNFEWKHSELDLRNAINANLPDDISIVELCRENNIPINPRYDAKLRVYRYQIYFSDVNIPTLERFYWRVTPEPDFKVLKESANLFIGQHDFGKFGKPYAKGGRTERIIDSIELIQVESKRLHVRITANSFLYHMVRRIMFTIILAGLGKVTLQNVADEIEGFDNLPPGIAPAKGLFLEKIIY